MTSEEQEIYNDGYYSYFCENSSEDENTFFGTEAELWLKGWNDAKSTKEKLFLS